MFTFTVGEKTMRLVDRFEMAMVDHRDVPSKPKESQNLCPANLEELTACLRSNELMGFVSHMAREIHVIALDTLYPMMDDIKESIFKENEESLSYLRGIRRVKGIMFKPGIYPSIGGYDFDGHDIGETWYQPPWDRRFAFLFVEDNSTNTKAPR